MFKRGTSNNLEATPHFQQEYGRSWKLARQKETTAKEHENWEATPKNKWTDVHPSVQTHGYYTLLSSENRCVNLEVRVDRSRTDSGFARWTEERKLYSGVFSQ